MDTKALEERLRDLFESAKLLGGKDWRLTKIVITDDGVEFLGRLLEKEEK